MALCGKFFTHFGREPVFQLNVAAAKSVFGETRRFESRLDVHLEIHNVGDELGVSLRLVPASHDPECHARLAFLRKRRNDRVQRALVAG